MSDDEHLQAQHPVNRGSSQEVRRECLVAELSAGAGQACHSDSALSSLNSEMDFVFFAILLVGFETKPRKKYLQLEY